MNIWSDIKRAVCSRGFIAGVLGMFLVIAFACADDFLKAVRKPELFKDNSILFDALHSDAFTLVLPILCTLPFTTAFIDDIKSGFIKQYLSRTSRRQYIAGKLIACGLSGFLVLFTGGIISALFETGIIAKAFTLGFAGMFWSLAGFTFASLTMNRYMAYASPFILYYLLIILHERYFYRLNIIEPREWGFLQPIVLTIIVSTAFALFAERRLKNV